MGCGKACNIWDVIDSVFNEIEVVWKGDCRGVYVVTEVLVWK